MSVVSGIVGADAAESAADTQAGAATESADAKIAAYERAAKLRAENAQKAAEVQIKAAQDADAAVEAGLTRIHELERAGASAAVIQQEQNALDQAQRFADEAKAQSEAALATATEQSDSILEFTNMAVAEQKAFVQKAVDFNQPYIDAGTNALATLQERIAAGPGEFEESPGYQFRLAEGNKAIDRQQSRQGSVLSGSALKAGVRFAEDYATNDYDNFLNRYYDSLKPLERTRDVGAAAAGQSASITANAGSNIAGLLQRGGTDAADALARGKYGAADITAKGARNQNLALSTGEQARVDYINRTTGIDTNFLRDYYGAKTNTIRDIGDFTAAGLTGETEALAGGITNAGEARAEGISDAGTAEASGDINTANAITGALQSGVNTGLNAVALWKYFA